MTPTVAIIIPTHRRPDRLAACLQSVHASDFQDFVVVVVNDGRCERTSAMLRDRFPSVVELASDHDLWWAGSMNRGVAHARSAGIRYCLALNDDVTVAPTAVRSLVRAADASPCSIVCSVIVDAREPHIVWAAGGGVDWSKRGEFHHTRLPRPGERPEVDWSPGMGTVIPTTVFDAVGTYDAINMPQYLADADLCFRARRAGFKTLLCPESVVYNDTALTGGLKRRGRISLRAAVSVYASRRSSDFVRARAAFMWRHCPPALVIPAFVGRYARVTAYVCRRLLP